MWIDVIHPSGLTNNVQNLRKKHSGIFVSIVNFYFALEQV